MVFKKSVLQAHIAWLC